MLRNCIVIASIAVCASGCATMHQLDLSTPSEAWVADAQQRLLNEDVSVILLNGRMVEGMVTRMTADSLWLRPEEVQREWGTSFQEVSLIKSSRATGAVVGGILGGALVGGMIGAAAEAGQPLQERDVAGRIAEAITTPFRAMSGLCVGALIGAPVGGLIIGMMTSVNDYSIIHGPAQKPKREK